MRAIQHTLLTAFAVAGLVLPGAATAQAVDLPATATDLVTHVATDAGTRLCAAAMGLVTVVHPDQQDTCANG